MNFLSCFIFFIGISNTFAAELYLKPVNSPAHGFGFIHRQTKPADDIEGWIEVDSASSARILLYHASKLLNKSRDIEGDLMQWKLLRPMIAVG